MTSKVEIMEQVKLLLKKRGVDSIVDDREIEKILVQKLASVIRKRFFDKKNIEVGEINGEFIYEFEQEVNKRTDGYYATIPSQSIDLMFGKGIQSVSPKKEPSTVYRPLQSGFDGLYEGLDSSFLEGSIGYVRKGVNIVFRNMNSLNNPDAVIIRMVAPFSDVDEDEPLNIPNDIVNEIVAWTFNDFVRTLSLPEDETNDSIDEAV